MSNPTDSVVASVLVLCLLAALASAHAPVLIAVILFLAAFGIAVIGFIKLVFLLTGDRERDDG